MDSVRRVHVLPTGEGRVALEPSPLAWRISGMELESDGSLRTVYGYCTWEPNYVYNRPHAIVHAFIGSREVLLLHHGPHLYRHTGWGTTWEDLFMVGNSLKDDVLPWFAGQFALVADSLVYCSGNGTDPLLATWPNGLSDRIGFLMPPASPQALGPTQLNHAEATRTGELPNSAGYSWSGSIGTIGDEISIEECKVLAGTWYYYAQWEDLHGNLSPISGVSNGVELYAYMTDVAKYEQADDLTRQFSVLVDNRTAPLHTAAVRLYRTSDCRNVGTLPRFLVRFGTPCLGAGDHAYPDSRPDSSLGAEMVPIAPIPTPKVICAHAGALAIGNLPGEPGKVMVSEPGFPGTFRADRWTFPDQNGEVTGLASYQGMLVAFSENTARIVNADMTVVAIPNAVGCVAPGSVREIGGLLVWLGVHGVYSFDGSQVACISEELAEVFEEDVNSALARASMSAVVGDTYYLVVPRAGSIEFDYMLAWTPGRGWREFDLPWKVHCMCAVTDREYLLLGIFTGQAYDVVCWDHAHYLTNYTPMASIYRSGWLRVDDGAVESFRPKNVYVRVIDSWAGTASIRFYKDGEYADPIVVNPSTGSADQTFYLASDGFKEATDYDNAGDLLIGTDRVKQPAATWRRIPCPVDTCHEFQFEIESEVPMHIAGFAFDLEIIAGKFGRFQEKGT